MKTRILFIAILFLGITFNTVRAEGEIRKLPTFSEISFGISGTLHLEQGAVQSVRVVAKSSDLNELVTEVKGRSLIVRFRNNNFFWRSFNRGKVDIYVTVPDIHALSVSGSGKIIAGENIKSPALDIAVSGSGNISLNNLESKRVKAAISGSGNIHVRDGRTDELFVSVSGSGNMRAQEFRANHVETKISGSGNCNIHAHNTLKARVTGSGSVSYKGSPQIESAVTGSGRLKKL
jgi:hypothetical protein